MSGPLATREPEEADYAAIESAVMETERGRWFLGQFARRNRHAETERLLDSLSRIERAVSPGRDSVGIDRFRLDVLEMSRAIARTRAEIAAIKPPETDGRIIEASGELDSIVSATEQATSEILAAAERIQEIAWALREAGADASFCDQLDQNSVAVYTSCSFQDLTAQRTRKVIGILAFLESRVNAMADIWEFVAEERPDAAPAAEAEARAEERAGGEPAPPMSQEQIDFVLVEEEFRKAEIGIEIEMDHPPAPREILGPRAAYFEGDLISVPTQAMAPQDEPADRESPQEPPPTAAEAAAAALDDAFLFEARPEPAPAAARAQLQIVGGVSAHAAVAKVRSGADLTHEEAAAALDALQAMSVEERTKLFS
jgi:chemotaxis regulatin CheY-phosphate phosphatase CheZ